MVHRVARVVRGVFHITFWLCSYKIDVYTMFLQNHSKMPKTLLYGLRLSPEEKFLLEKHAKAQHLTVAEYIRQTCIHPQAPNLMERAADSYMQFLQINGGKRGIPI